MFFVYTSQSYSNIVLINYVVLINYAMKTVKSVNCSHRVNNSSAYYCHLYMLKYFRTCGMVLILS